jgi:two-component system, cell cycle sensor histidine kinase and response regulator CckA
MRSIQVKFLFSIGIVTSLFSIFILYRAYSLTNERIKDGVKQEASIALNFDLAIRQYVATNIRPLMYRLVKQDEFIPETMSTSYVARSIFDKVRKEFPDYIIKFSSDNPRNPANQAGKAELKIIEMFNNDPRLKRWNGIISIDGKPYMSKFSARRMEPSCLRCHGNPSDAPASLVKRYGSKAGFHRQVGKVIGLDTVAVPMDKINKKLWTESIKNIFVSSLGIFLLFTGIALAFKFLITDRLRSITRHFEQVAEQTDYADIQPLEIKGKDEINTLASGFNRLSEKLKEFYASMDRKVQHRTIELEKANEKLLQEIRERKETEDALRESEEKYRKVLSANPDPVVVYDDEGKVIYFNAAFTRVFGWRLEDRLNQKMDVFVPDENWPETRMMIEKVKAGEDFYGIETQRITKDKKRVDVSISGAVYRDSEGRPVGSIISLRDITAKKRLKAEAMRAGHLASIGELAAGVAHEINNPISGIIGYAEILQDRAIAQESNGDIPEKIIKEGERIADIVKNLLSFARDRKEDHNLAHIKDILSDTLGLTERRIIKDGIELSVDVPAGLPNIKARSKEIQQVFLNIINNAHYALNHRDPEAGGDKFLEIESKTIAFRGRSYIRTIFHDNGSGIPENILNRISEPFFSTKPQGEGTGLGLSISHGIVENHGGRLWFESVEGAYTKAVIDLPVDGSQPL